MENIPESVKEGVTAGGIAFAFGVPNPLYVAAGCAAGSHTARALGFTGAFKPFPSSDHFIRTAMTGVGSAAASLVLTGGDTSSVLQSAAVGVAGHVLYQTAQLYYGLGVVKILF